MLNYFKNMKKYTFNNVVNFKCIDRACKKSCCKLWQIKIDKKSLNKYKELSASDNRFSENVDFSSATFNMTKNGDCKFLNKEGLCDLILGYGEGCLCQTCKTHPRFKSFFKGVTETGIGLSCEEGARLILTAKDKLKLVENKSGKSVCLTGQIKDNRSLSSWNKEVLKFRRRAISITQNRKLNISSRIEQLIKLSKTDIKNLPLKNWIYFLSGLERLDLDSNYFYQKLCDSNLNFNDLDLDKKEEQIPYEQLISYLLFRHLSKAQDYIDLYLYTSLCILLFYTVILGQARGEQLINSARIISTEIEYCEENINKILLELEGLVRLN